MSWDTPSDIALVGAFVISLVFVIYYGFKAPWRESEFGVHLLTFSAMIVQVLGWTIARRFDWVGGDPALGRTIVFAEVGAFMLWRLVIVWRAQNGRIAPPPAVRESEEVESE